MADPSPITYDRTIPFKGRRLVSVQNGNDTIIGYLADEKEKTRISNLGEGASGLVYPNANSNNQYDKYIVFVGGYKDSNIRTPSGFAFVRDDTARLGNTTNFDIYKNIIENPSIFSPLIYKPSPNISTTNPNQPGPDSGSTPVSNPNNPAPQESGVLKYPLSMKSDQDKIKFQAVQIKTRRTSQGTGLQFSFPTPEYDIVPGGPVVMGIQSPISDQNSVGWNVDNVSAIEAALYEKSLTLIKTPGSQLGSEVGKFMGQIMTSLREENEITKKYIAGQAAGLNNVIARTDNVILNPNLELLFSSPQLRPFSFQFKMSARNESEALQIRKIIRYFKQNMAVRKEDGLFLKAPYVFTIRYLKGNKDGTDELHKSINIISPEQNQKACALTNCSVDYTPLGSYMTYEDGTMVAYTLSLQFQELVPIYDDDYKNLPEDAIGY